ncbi:Microtubule cross-linking factor 1 [Channa argus]|uniref:Microtubule cross-linking factor 1 n=1 Tax=Channa argus TaxID=215402 RepID=A0A6G1PN63_CHAAH|nr:Microtubule cross-linking factor 1 [Channa argus]
MWSAFVNGSGLHGGGGAGGGYVQSQGWEFVPCSRMARADRDRGKNCSPLRRISSPPTVFSQIYEPLYGASAGGGEGGAGTHTEILRGQIWPGPEPKHQEQLQQQQQQPPLQQQQHQQQNQHTRLKKKFEELKKRHEQDKEEWMHEKESLLREVADIQGGENRRILLDLKTVLEEVQVEVKREEERRSELQLQYTRDRCAWQLEKAELKCRIGQLEAKEDSGLISGGVHSAAGPGSVPSQHSETTSLRREREEQRRLLKDTHLTTMDLRCRLEHSERDWLREKAELLERFDVERREWETQLKDMQRKIEELYCEVRAKREGSGLDGGRQDHEDVIYRLSIHSSSTGSSLLSDNSHFEPLSSCSHSELNRHPPLPSLGHKRNISGGLCGSTDGHQCTCFHTDNVCGFNIGAQFPKKNISQPELGGQLRSTATGVKKDVDTPEFDAFFPGAPGNGMLEKFVSKGNENSVHVSAKESPLWAELGYCSDKTKKTTALNAALKEIARVSEELCSYQDEIRRKSGVKSKSSESMGQPEESEILLGHNETQMVDEATADLVHIYDELRALERENWITFSPDHTWQGNRPSTSEPETQTNLQVLSEIDTALPPIPPRTSSWNLSTSSHPETELHIPESPMLTVKKCHSPCVLVDRKCNSPSIVRKFEAMLQENEGKVCIDGMVVSCSVPTNSNCNVGCCHNRWSCDTSKFTNSKLSAYGMGQKSFSEVNIESAVKDLPSDYSHGVGNLKSPKLQIPWADKESPVCDLLLSSLEVPPASPKLQGSRRNIMLEQKTAEFNRTLFQAEMGHGVEEQDSFNVTDATSVGCQPVLSASDEKHPPRESKFLPHCSDVTTTVTGAHPEVTLYLSTLDSTFHNLEIHPRGMVCGPEAQEVKIKQEITFDISSEKPQVRLRDATSTASQSSAHNSETMDKMQTASSPPRKTQNTTATEDLFSEPVLSAETQPGKYVNASSSKNENPHDAKPQPTRVGVSLQQLSAENKQRQMTQPGHQAQPRHVSVPPSQSESFRPGPRVMNDHPWKPLTLAAYPRLEGSRSNYGALERILKNYESAAQAQQNQQNKTGSSPNLIGRPEGNSTELNMLDMDPLTLSPHLIHTQTPHSSQSYSRHAQLSSHSATAVKGIELIVQGQED